MASIADAFMAWIIKNRVMAAYILGILVVACFITLSALLEAETQVNAKASKKG